MSRPNILHIIDTLGVGGAEKLVIGTINDMPDANHHLVYLTGADTLVSTVHPDCHVLKLNCHSKSDVLKTAFKLRRYIRQWHVDVVHSHLCMATLVARLACPRDVKLFTTIHNLPSKSYYKTSKWLKWAEKLTYRSWHHIIAICNEVYKDYNSSIGIKGPCSILYNCIDNKFFQSAYKSTSFNGHLKLVAVGNLKYQKNYPYLLEVFRNLPASVSLDIYGSGNLADSIQEEIDKHQLNIKLCGVRSDMEKVLPQYDAFVMSSHYEGQPLAVLEAMASGIPVLLADIPVLHEVTNSRGVFFDINNPIDLVAKIQSIACHQMDMELDAIGSANLQRARNIATRQQYIDNLQAIYHTPEVMPIPVSYFSVKTSPVFVAGGAS